MRLRPSTGSMSPENPICRAAKETVHKPAKLLLTSCTSNCSLNLSPLQMASTLLQHQAAQAITNSRTMMPLSLNAHGTDLLEQPAEALGKQGHHICERIVARPFQHQQHCSSTAGADTACLLTAPALIGPGLLRMQLSGRCA